MKQMNRIFVTMFFFLSSSIIFAQDTTLTVSENGNVGVGTTTPSELLHLQKSDNPTLKLQSAGDTAGRLSFRQANETGVDIFYNSAEDGLSFETFGGGASLGIPLYLKQNNGNVGIGTVSPTSKLEVAGMVHASSGGFKFPDGTTQETATKFMKFTLNLGATVPAIQGGRAWTTIGPISGLEPGATVVVSPSDLLPLGVVLNYALVSAENQVRILWINATSNEITVPDMDYYFTVFNPGNNSAPNAVNPSNISVISQSTD